MALIWADNFEMYGNRNIAVALNGIYADYRTSQIILDNGTPYLSVENPGGTNADSFLRFVLPGLRTTVGLGGFMWLASLPANTAQRPVPLAWKSAANDFLFTVGVLNTGQLVLVQGPNKSGTVLATTPSPVVTANQEIHIEGKLVVDDTEGSIEIKVRGRTVILLENINTGDIPVGQVTVSNYGDWPDGVELRWRHWFIWDSLGDVNNDFLGQVQCFWNRPLSTSSSGGWTSSADAPVDETLNKPRLANQLNASGNIVNNDTVRIANTYYRWTSGSVDTGTPAGTSANPWLVALGASTAESLQNMYEAINASGTAGATYSTVLVEHPTVSAFGISETAFCVIPKVEGTTTMTFSETGSALEWTSTDSFLDRVWDTICMSAGYTPAVKATGSVEVIALPVVDETVTIGDEVFTFKTTAANPFEVTIGGTTAATAANLAATVNSNSTYVIGDVTAEEVVLTAISAGASGNTIALTTTSISVFVSGATLTGGVNVTYPDPFEVRLSPLPDDVTSIRAIIPVVRAAKQDGGDGNIQVSFGTLPTNYDVGPDTPITNAFTYWGNATEPYVSEINPDTGLPWTPGEFNLGARVRVNRTK